MGHIVRCMAFILLQFCICGYTNSSNLFNVFNGTCYSWGFSDSYIIRSSAINLVSPISTSIERSFLECCLKCDFSTGCKGVLFDGKVCFTLENVSGLKDQSLASGYQGSDSVRLMLFHDVYVDQAFIPTSCEQTTRCQVYNKSCYIDCEACPDVMDRIVDCQYLYEQGYHTDGVYIINPSDNKQFSAFCDMTKDGGGWTVFQRRVDNSTDFYRNYASYQNGFGDLDENLWLGLDNLHELASNISYEVELHVYMESFDNETYFAKYDSFSIGDASSDYIFHAHGYSGNAGDGFSGPITSNANLNGMRFTTYDKDNDKASGNCAVKFRGAWWYKACHRSNLNGFYHEGEHDTFADGMNWYPARGHHYSMKTSVMKLRRKI